MKVAPKKSTHKRTLYSAAYPNLQNIILTCIDADGVDYQRLARSTRITVVSNVMDHHADEARQLDIREVRPRAACTLERLHLSSGPTLGLQGRLDKVHFFRTKQTYFFRMVNTHFVRPFRSEQFFEIMHLFDDDSSNGRPRSHGAVLW